MHALVAGNTSQVSLSPDPLLQLSIGAFDVRLWECAARTHSKPRAPRGDRVRYIELEQVTAPCFRQIRSSWKYGG